MLLHYFIKKNKQTRKQQNSALVFCLIRNANTHTTSPRLCWMQQCQQTGQDPQIWWFPPQGSLCSPERQKQLLMIYCGYNTRNELVKEYIGDVNGPIIYTNTTEAISSTKYYTQHASWRFQTPYSNSCAHLCPPYDESSSENLHPLQMLQGVVANTPSYLLVKNVSGNIPPSHSDALSHWNHFTPNFPTLDTDV